MESNAMQKSYSYDLEFFNNMGLIIIEGVQKRRPLDLHFVARYNYYLEKLNKHGEVGKIDNIS